MSPEPLAFFREISLEPPSAADKTADSDRLVAALEGLGLQDVSIPLHVMKKLPGLLRGKGFTLKVLLARTEQKVTVLEAGIDRAFGLALDIGSTNIDCSLFDLSNSQKIDEASAENPQTAFGADVLTRAQRSMMGEYEPQQRALIEGINSLIHTICAGNGILEEEVFALAVAGNTIMSHFFLGLEVCNIPLSPYIPALNRAFSGAARELGLTVNPGALVYVFPNAGSYVGGDIISGMTYAGISRSEKPVLFIDVGTNVEIALGCRDWIMVGAGAAGPALEGGVAAIGRKAERGTISKVRIDRQTGEVETEVISGGEPEGICGSGMIDLVAELFSAGIIDQAGRFTGSGGLVTQKEGSQAFVLYRKGDRELLITEKEIQNFLLSKAAMFSFLYVFVKSVGLGFRDIEKVYIAGALGCGIDPEKAIAIGMLPDIPRDRIVPLGNSSLRGAEMVLTNGELAEEIGELAAKITYREMNEDSELMNVLQGALFIPHTEPELLKA